MKRKITGAILISLGLGLFWQALAQGLDCQTLCREKYVQCRDSADKSIDRIRSLKDMQRRISHVFGELR